MTFMDVSLKDSLVSVLYYCLSLFTRGGLEIFRGLCSSNSRKKMKYGGSKCLKQLTEKKKARSGHWQIGGWHMSVKKSIPVRQFDIWVQQTEVCSHSLINSVWCSRLCLDTQQYNDHVCTCARMFVCVCACGYLLNSRLDSCAWTHKHFKSFLWLVCLYTLLNSLPIMVYSQYTNYPAITTAG